MVNCRQQMTSGAAAGTPEQGNPQFSDAILAVPPDVATLTCTCKSLLFEQQQHSKPEREAENQQLPFFHPAVRKLLLQLKKSIYMKKSSLYSLK